MIDQVRQYVVESLAEMNFDTSTVTGDTVLGPAGLDLESLAVAELTMRVEETYGIHFVDDELEKFRDYTVDQFSAEVATRVGPAAQLPAGTPE